MRRRSLKLVCMALLLTGVSFALPNFAIGAEDLAKLYLDATPILDVRYRYEMVDQQGFDKDANANTMRTRFGFETGKVHGFGLGVDGEWITSLGNDRFNSTTNGRTSYPTVADPDDFTLNQLFLVSDGTIPKTRIKLGRQRMIWDNARFIGNVGWRQNEQTFDALRLSTRAIPNLEVEYAFLEETHRIFGSRSSVGRLESDSHGFRLQYTGWNFATITPFALLLDYDLASQAANESATYGILLNGKHKLNPDLTLLYTGSAAHQSNYADNTADYDLWYFMLEPGLTYTNLTAKLGYEVLQGDGVNSFRTPLATLHNDKFLTTPGGGIQDLNVKLSTKTPANSAVPGVFLTAAYYEFFSEESGSHYGREWNMSAEKTFDTEHGEIVLGLKYADYDADKFATNTRKLWLTLNFKLGSRPYRELVRK